MIVVYSKVDSTNGMLTFFTPETRRFLGMLVPLRHAFQGRRRFVPDISAPMRYLTEAEAVLYVATGELPPNVKRIQTEYERDLKRRKNKKTKRRAR